MNARLKGSGGIIKMPGHVFDGMFVDFKSRDKAGVWVVLTEPRGDYRAGDIFHVSEWEYEHRWMGTV